MLQIGLEHRIRGHINKVRLVNSASETQPCGAVRDRRLHLKRAHASVPMAKGGLAGCARLDLPRRASVDAAAFAKSLGLSQAYSD